jgi:hypothetical protein
MYISILAKLISALAAFSYSLIHLFKIDPISYVTKNENILFILNLFIIYSVSTQFFNRDYYLPFLGPTVIPIKEQETVGKLIDIQLTGLNPNTRVLYWASNESDKTFDNPIEAYKGYGNSGVVKTDNQGNVVIKVNCPSDYYVSTFGMNKKLSRHIHYRTESDRFPGLFSSVKTKYINC